MNLQEKTSEAWKRWSPELLIFALLLGFGFWINRGVELKGQWGTDSKVRLFDPASGLHIELGASGEFNIRVTDSRKLLLKVVGISSIISTI